MNKTLVLALLMLGPTAGFAQNNQFAVVPGNPNSSKGASEVVACIFQDGGGDYHAGIQFNASHDGSYHIEGYYYDGGFFCETDPNFVAGDLSLMAGPNIVYLTTPLPVDTLWGMFWAQVGVYFGDHCDSYWIPYIPDPCM